MQKVIEKGMKGQEKKCSKWETQIDLQSFSNFFFIFKAYAFSTQNVKDRSVVNDKKSYIPYFLI